MTGISKEHIGECIIAYRNSFITDYTYITGDGIETSLFNFLPAGEIVDKDMQANDMAIEFLAHEEKVCLKRQECQKPLLAKLLTSNISFQVQGNEHLLEKARTFSFFGNEVFIIPCAQGMPLMARKIALLFGLSEQSVSRTYKSFVSFL